MPAPRRTVGRTVHTYHNLQHPAWAGAAVPEFIGTAVITSIRTDFVSEHKIIKLDSGFEYSLATGDQHHSGATRFVFAD